MGLSVLCTRAPRPPQELHVAHGDGSLGKRLAQLARLDEPTLADAILYRIVHGSHKIALKGESMRKLTKTA